MVNCPYPVITLPNTWKPDKLRGYDPVGTLYHSMGQFIKDDNGKVWSAADWLEHLGLSPHAMVGPDGTIYLAQSWNKVAYHAGNSRFKTWNGLNTPFLGVEFLIAGEHNYSSHRKAIQSPEAFTEAHYQAGAWLGRHLMELFPTNLPEHQLRHSDVSGPDVRDDYKIDPGPGFDWPRFKTMLANG